MKFEVKKVKYKNYDELCNLLEAFSKEGWEYIETKETDYYGPLKYYSDKILFRKQ